MKSVHCVITLCDLPPHLAILSLVVGPGQELQQGQQKSNSQSHAQEDEDAPQVIRLQALGDVIPVGPQAAAGPPLLPQEH